MARILAEEQLEQLQDSQNLVQQVSLIALESHIISGDSINEVENAYQRLMPHIVELDRLTSKLSRLAHNTDILTLHQSCQKLRNSAYIVTSLRTQKLQKKELKSHKSILNKFQNILHQQVDTIHTAASSISKSSTQNYRSNIERLARVTQNNSKLVFFQLISCLMLAWLLSHFFFEKYIVTRLKTVSKYLRNPVNIPVSTMVPVYGEDEIAEMARSVELLIENRRQLVLAQQSLSQSEAMQRAITDAVQSAVFLIDDKDTIQFVNPAAQTMFGYIKEEFIGKKLHTMLVPKKYQETASKGLAHFSKTGKGPVLDKMQEMVALHKDGKELTTLVHVGKLWRNKAWWAVGSVIDITKLKEIQADLIKSQQEAIQTGRLASIGHLAAGMAHVINTPAQYVGDNLIFINDSISSIRYVFEAARNLAESSPKSQATDAFTEACSNEEILYIFEELPSAISQSQDGMRYITKIVQSMKAFSHPGNNQKSFDDINKILDAVITITHNSYKEVATVETHFAPDIPLILCCASEIQQVFLNLMINAIQSIQDSNNKEKELGKIDISTVSKDDFVIISVADTGDGVPEEIRDRIFDPFYTTKPVGQGTGQGLSICYDIVVNKHSGTIEVGNNPESGAIFTIQLPIEATDDHKKSDTK
ncbi:PAS domain-containing sensor histidine kinase [Maridesulfovibrio zosterae]|uniref:PAS domain-containing sensor histidine kinase n=1 Tax=Maridesulfovibrio zosterae TaxID=82171 RepID=UPI00146AFC0F|nr:ATP-binding protein [Maridesulfovibrio zosterae]